MSPRAGPRSLGISKSELLYNKGRSGSRRRRSRLDVDVGRLGQVGPTSGKGRYNRAISSWLAATGTTIAVVAYSSPAPSGRQIILITR